MRKYLRQIEQAKQKAEQATRLALEAQLPMSELIAGVREDIEGFAAELGLTIIQRVMAAEIDQKTGRWGQQKNHRHGHQSGYVVYAGRKTTEKQPRLLSRNRSASASYRRKKGRQTQ